MRAALAHAEPAWSPLSHVSLEPEVPAGERRSPAEVAAAIQRRGAASHGAGWQAAWSGLERERELTVPQAGARLAGAFLAYLAVVVLLVTLVPFDFAVPDQFQLYTGAQLGDALANILMFVPLGFLFQLAQPASADRRALRALLLGALLSLSVESAQLFLAERFSSPVDVITNALGAWLGAQLELGVARRLAVTPALVGRLALELPLMGLVYLLVPLLWLAGLAAAASPQAGRAALLLPAGLVGAVILGQVWRHQLGPAGALSRRRLAGVAAGWFGLGAFTALGHSPWLVLGGAAFSGALAWLVAGRHLPPGPERRYEGPTLRAAAPLLALFLLALTLWHATEAPYPRGGIRWGSPFTSAGTAEILEFLELCAAYTVAGYLIAEWRGRAERTPREAMVTATAVALGSAVALELLVLAVGGPGGSLLRALAAAGAAAFGAWVYRLQLGFVRALVRRQERERLDPEVPRAPPVARW